MPNIIEMNGYIKKENGDLIEIKDAKAREQLKDRVHIEKEDNGDFLVKQGIFEKDVDETEVATKADFNTLNSQIVDLKNKVDNLPSGGGSVSSQFVQVLSTILSKVSFYDEDVSEDIALLQSMSSDREEQPTVEEFDISYNLTDVTSSNTNVKIVKNMMYATTLSLDDGIENKDVGNVIVTMDGKDITKSCYSEDDNSINIAKVTGDVVISAEAVAPKPLYKLANPIVNMTANNMPDIVIDTGIKLFPENVDRTVLCSVTLSDDASIITNNQYIFTSSVNNDPSHANETSIVQKIINYNGVTDKYTVVEINGTKALWKYPDNHAGQLGKTVKTAISYHADTQSFDYYLIEMDNVEKVRKQTIDGSAREFAPSQDNLTVGGYIVSTGKFSCKGCTINEFEVHKFALTEDEIVNWMKGSE